MPASVIKSKQAISLMTDQEFTAKYGHKSEKELRDMAARHGYGWDRATKTGSDYYLNRIQKNNSSNESSVGEGYKVLPNIDRDRYTERPGLEGPFSTLSGKVVYYDPKEGSYYDPDSDIYLSYDEFKSLDNDYSGMTQDPETKKKVDESVTAIKPPKIDLTNWPRNRLKSLSSENYQYLVNMYLDGMSAGQVEHWAGNQGPYYPRVAYKIQRIYGNDVFKLMQKNPTKRREIAAKYNADNNTVTEPASNTMSNVDTFAKIASGRFAFLNNEFVTNIGGSGNVSLYRGFVERHRKVDFIKIKDITSPGYLEAMAKNFRQARWNEPGERNYYIAIHNPKTNLITKVFYVGTNRQKANDHWINLAGKEE